MKKHLLPFLSLCLAASVLAESPNLLQNGDFAFGRKVWQNRTQPAQSVSVEETSGAPGGVPALKIAVTEDGGKNHGQIVQFRQDVKPDAVYRVSALVNSDVADTAYVQVKLMKGKSEGTRFSTDTAKEAGKWVEVSAEIPTEADTTGIQVLLRFRMNGGLVGKTVRFADVRLVGVSGGAETDAAPPALKKPEAVKPVVAGPGADRYITPGGAGTKDGTSWENALPGTKDAFARAVSALGPGNTLYVGGGAYDGNFDIVFAAGGESLDKPVTMKGVDRGVEGFPRPVFTGSWKRSKPAGGPTLIQLRPGACFIVLENFDVHNYNTALSALGPNHGLRIRHVDTLNTRDAFWIDGGMVEDLPDSGTSDLLMEDCRIVNHTKKGVRTMNGLHHSKFVRCFADAGGKEFANIEPRDIFSGGFHVLGSYRAKDGVRRADHHIEFIDCEANNNYYDPGQKSYWNADGFCAEGATEDISFIRCRAFNNTDGGWDIKTTRVKFIDCVGIGNKRNFRVWTKAGAPVLFRNCLSSGAVDFGGKNRHDVGFWNHGGGEVTYERCTSWGDRTCFSIEKGEKTSVTLDRCLFVPAAEGETFGRMESEVTLENKGSVYDDEARAEKFRAPDVSLRADPGDRFDCVSKPELGYAAPGPDGTP